MSHGSVYAEDSNPGKAGSWSGRGSSRGGGGFGIRLRGAGVRAEPACPASGSGKERGRDSGGRDPGGRDPAGWHPAGWAVPRDPWATCAPASESGPLTFASRASGRRGRRGAGARVLPRPGGHRAGDRAGENHSGLSEKRLDRSEVRAGRGVGQLLLKFAEVARQRGREQLEFKPLRGEILAGENSEPRVMPFVAGVKSALLTG